MPAPDVMPPQPVYEHVGDREASLRTLLGVEYDYAKDSGLIDMFAYNEQTGEDALIHTLAGDYRPGTTIPRGFHHGPSGEAVWPSVMNADGVAEPVTRILYSGKEHHYMEPSYSLVAVGGLEKMLTQRHPKTGELTTAVGRFGMFPDEYDALAVMQAIRIAKENPVPDQKIQQADDKPFFTMDGLAPLIDGKSHMKIRMVIDRATGKIVTAFPKTRGKPIMGLTEDQMWEHIMRPTTVDR